MAATHSTTQTAHETHAHHHEPSFMRKYIFSPDHKVIGIQSGITALYFLLFCYLLMAAMRWQIANPITPIPVAGALLQKFLGQDMAPGGVMTGDLYNAFGAMHGTIMVFLAIVPLAF